jgi:hypothetical protein
MPASPAQALRGRTRRLVAGCCASAAAALALTPAALAADREITVAAASPQAWEGRAALTASLLEPATLVPCAGTAADVCDTTLLHVHGEGTLSVALAARDADTPDVDLYVYRSDPLGVPGPLVGVAAGPGANERVEVAFAGGDYLVRGVSFAMGKSGFAGSATLTARAPAPDVDHPRGRQEALVSDPRDGAASQPAVAAQGDRIYAAYRVFGDPQTYVSRLATAVSNDGGRRWHSLGVVSPAPAANPALVVTDAGDVLLTANEQVADGRWSVAVRRRGHRSWDPATVLSLPPAGTIDERPVLAAHGDDVMACWNRTTEAGAFTSQAVLCRRSPDGGSTWQAVSRLSPASLPGVPYGPYVSGVAVTHHAGAFTVAWVDTRDPAGEDSAWVSRSADGAAWSAPVHAAAFTALPDRFPGARFRNVTLLTLTAARGQLYLGFAAAGPVIRVARSDDAGAHWSEPMTAASGFQPSLAVTRHRVVVSYLSPQGDYADERRDVARAPAGARAVGPGDRRAPVADGRSAR